jgi:hypothetical protein
LLEAIERVSKDLDAHDRRAAQLAADIRESSNATLGTVNATTARLASSVDSLVLIFKSVADELRGFRRTIAWLAGALVLLALGKGAAEIIPAIVAGLRGHP